MKIDLWKCDCCQKEFRTNGGVELALPLDTFTPDAAGGPSERDYKFRDLCGACAKNLINELARLCVKSPDGCTKKDYLALVERRAA